MDFDFFKVVWEELLVELGDGRTLSQFRHILDITLGILDLVVEIELFLQSKQVRGVYGAIIFRCA